MDIVRSFVLSGGLLVGLAAQAPAQIGINTGNPLNGQAYATTTPGLGGYSTFGGVGGTGYGYSSGYSGYSSVGGLGLGSYSNYGAYSNTGYLAGPGVIGQTYGYPGVGNYGYPGVGNYGYNSGYAGVGNYGYNSGYAGIVGNPYGYRSRSLYGTYGGGAYGNGFRPFRAVNPLRRF